MKTLGPERAVLVASPLRTISPRGELCCTVFDLIAPRPAAGLGLSMRRWDFTAAYLQGELLEDEVVVISGLLPLIGAERLTA